MNDLPQKTHQAFKAGANFGMDESNLTFTVICVGIVILLAMYIVYCVLKGIGDDSIKIKDAPVLIVRAVLLIIIVGVYFTFT